VIAVMQVRVEEAAPDFLTIAQVAALLQVSERTVIRLTKAPRDRLLAARFGGITRIRRAVLEQWISRKERAA
jgi:excisionase family DNA binding protein